jgi:hypothetical protein
MGSDIYGQGMGLVCNATAVEQQVNSFCFYLVRGIAWIDLRLRIHPCHPPQQPHPHLPQRSSRCAHPPPQLTIWYSPILLSILSLQSMHNQASFCVPHLSSLCAPALLDPGCFVQRPFLTR